MKLWLIAGTFLGCSLFLAGWLGSAGFQRAADDEAERSAPAGVVVRVEHRCDWLGTGRPHEILFFPLRVGDCEIPFARRGTAENSLVPLQYDDVTIRIPDGLIFTVRYYREGGIVYEVGDVWPPQ